jgi:hypothetical protein
MLSGTAGIVTLSGGTLTLSGATSLITSPAISVTTLTAFNSITSPVVSATTLTAFNSITSPVVSATTLTAFGGTFRTSLSTVTISADNLVVSGYPLQAVSRVYQVGTTAATSTYTIALSDNNNTLTMFVGTSGLIVIPSPTTFPIGFQTNIMQLSTGRVLLSAQSANTLFNDMSSYRTLKQYSAATIINLGSIWVTYGSLSS